MKYMVGYCWDCCEKTKQQVIECNDSTAYRVFETVFTLGWGLMLPHDFQCECIKCGRINTIRK